MTKTEAAELQELGLDIAEIDARQARMSAMLHSDNVPANEMHSIVDKPTRKRRSDAGKPKPKKAEAVPGVLTQEQVDKLRELMEAREQALQANTEAENAMLKACENFDVYLDSLKGNA